MGLPRMFQIYREELASQLSSRFALDTTLSKHILLALRMNPSVDTSAEGSQFLGKVAKWEMRQAEYTTKLTAGLSAGLSALGW